MKPVAGTGLLAAGLVLATSATAESLRCDDGIVSVGDPVSAVLAACGEPWHRAVQQRKLGRGLPVEPPARIIDVETWTYRRGPGRFVQVLTFEGGRLARIDRGTRE